jgi:hypothetical protein
MGFPAESDPEVTPGCCGSDRGQRLHGLYHGIAKPNTRTMRWNSSAVIDAPPSWKLREQPFGTWHQPFDAESVRAVRVRHRDCARQDVGGAGTTVPKRKRLPRKRKRQNNRDRSRICLTSAKLRQKFCDSLRANHLFWPPASRGGQEVSRQIPAAPSGKVRAEQRRVR